MKICKPSFFLLVLNCLNCGIKFLQMFMLARSRRIAQTITYLCVFFHGLVKGQPEIMADANGYAVKS